MRHVSAIARALLGVVFVVFGLNGFLNFLPMGSVPPLALQFIGALIQSHYMAVVLTIEIGGGLLLLTGRYAALGSVVLAPVIVNIVMFHMFLAPAGLPLAAIVVALWLVSAYPYRALAAPLFQQGANAIESATASPSRSAVRSA